MKSFWGYASNGEYSVGCTGRTVYLYDKDGNEIAKFKDINHGYTPMISPDGKMFVVKSSDGRLAVYSLETFSLVKKFRFSKADGGQDGGFCFSPDGALFFNIELHRDTAVFNTISVYDTKDFSLVTKYLIDKNMTVTHVEYDRATDGYYVLGFTRDKRFVAKFEDSEIRSITYISENEFLFYSAYKSAELSGFSTVPFEIMDIDREELRAMNHTLAKLYVYYNK